MLGNKARRDSIFFVFFRFAARAKLKGRRFGASRGHRPGAIRVGAGTLRTDGDSLGQRHHRTPRGRGPMHRRLLRRRAGVLLANAARGGPRIRQAFRQPTSGAPARGLHLPGLHSALHRCDAARLYRRPARRGRAATAGCRLDSRPRSRSESARVAEGRVSAAYGPSDARGRCG